MPAFQFRFGTRFPFTGARLRQAFAPRKPRHPLLRLVTGLLGLAVVLALVFLGLFVGAAMLALGVLARLWRMRGQPMARGISRNPPHVVDGQFRVLTRPVLPPA